MPSSTASLRVPSYRRHRPTGQAVVTLCGRDIYLGKWGTKPSRREYDRLVQEWLAGGRSLPPDEPGALTVAELVSRYWQFAKRYYVKGGKPSGAIPGIKIALRLLRETYGPTMVAEFGPLALRALRRKMIGLGQSRRYVNDNVDRIRRVFKWGVAEELVPPAVSQALAAVSGLRKGRTEARESVPIGPVADDVVDATLARLPAVVADMVRFQRLTGCRPAEVCLLRPIDVQREDDVWLYRPESHKTEHHGRERIICIGPKAQSLLLPYLLRDETSFCFVPAESERKRNADRRDRRQSPMTPSQAKRRPKHKRGRAPGERYDVNSYRRAIHRAVELVNRGRAKQGDREPLPKWSPNRLRHSAATEIRRLFGLESAQVALGHAQADVTQVYAERDLELALEVARKIG